MTVKQFILGAMMLMSTTAFAQQQPAAETSDNTVPQQARLFIMASELVRYGYAQKSALPLIQAVQIYKDLGVTDATTGEQKAQSGTAVTSTLVKGDAIQFDETKLLADATTFVKFSEIEKVFENIVHPDPAVKKTVILFDGAE